MDNITNTYVKFKYFSNNTLNYDSKINFIYYIETSGSV